MLRPKFWEETSKKRGAPQSTGVCAAPHNWRDNGSQGEIQMTNLQILAASALSGRRVRLARTKAL
jgi:hypothetical protein